MKKQRIYAALLLLGASILLYRTISMMLFENALKILAGWVIGLLFLEFFIDLGCLLSAVNWLVKGKGKNAALPLRLGAMATILHALRVLIYVLGRTGPWVNFDVKPAYRNSYTFDWFWVYFAGILSVLGIVGAVVIWWMISRNKKMRAH